MQIKIIKTLAVLLFWVCVLHQQASARTVTIALNANVNTLDPHMTASVPDVTLLSNLYPTLVQRDAALHLRPGVSISWHAMDPLTWRFELVQTAKFADDEPLDATAVKWNIDRVLDKKINARLGSWFSMIESTQVVNPAVIDIKTRMPYAALPAQMSMLMLLPPKWSESHSPSRETSSGGPYLVTEMMPGDHYTLRRNPNYWGKPPAFDTVIYKVMPEPAARVAALLSGEVDVVSGLQPSEVPRINKSNVAIAVGIPSIRSAFIKINADVFPFKGNPELRQAVNYAINKEEIVKTLFNGRTALSNCQPLTSDYFGYNPDLKPYPYDPEKARQLLRVSGFDRTKEIVLDVPIGVYLQGEEVAQIVAYELQQIGLRIKINQIDFSKYMAKYVKTHQLASLSMITQAWPSIDADGLLTLFSPGNPYAYWNNAEFGRLVMEGRSTLDVSKRQIIYKKATELMCKCAPVIFLYQQPAVFGLSKNIRWSPRADEFVRAIDISER